MKLLWKLRFILKDYWQQYLLAFICLQIVSVLNLLPPWLIGHVIDSIKDNSLTNRELAGYVAGILITGIVVYGFRYIWRAKLYGASIELIRQQRSRLFAHFTRLSPEFYQHHTTGDLMAHATNDLNAVEESVGVGIMTLVDSLIAGFTVLFAMIFLVSGQLTLLAMLPFPVLVWATKRYGVALYSRFGRSQAAFSSLNEETRESITGIRAVKAHQLTERQTRRFEQLSMEAVAANSSVARVDALFGPSISLFFGLSFVLALVGGAWLISHGQMTVGLLTSFTLYLSQMLGPMLQFGWQFNVFQRGSASWGRLEKLLSRQPKVSNAPDARQAPDDTSLSINIRSFGYDSVADQKPVLQGISAEIPAGAFIGITGRTGSGKSTLLRLILREFDLPEGSAIQMGNIPLPQLSVESLRKKLAWVPQEPMLFSGTITDNIRFSTPDASQQAVEQAARLAAIDDEIMGFKDGYNTLLGENGINLSGGQKQRLALARALLADSEILLLDDAFSALDMKTEARILKNLMAMKGKKTIILVTQRLPELIKADHILVLDRGRIIEQGNHEQLLSKAKEATGQPEQNTTEHWYAKIFRQQARALLHPLEVKPDAVNKRSDVA